MEITLVLLYCVLSCSNLGHLVLFGNEKYHKMLKTEVFIKKMLNFI